MKIAEGLLLRADLVKKIKSLQDRAVGNCRVLEGDEPHEDPIALLQEGFRSIQDLETLIVRINRTNLVGRTEAGQFITEAMAERDRLKRQHGFINEMITDANTAAEYYSNREIRWKTRIDVRALQKQADDLAQKLRELNTAIQQANWNVELLD